SPGSLELMFGLLAGEIRKTLLRYLLRTPLFLLLYPHMQINPDTAGSRVWRHDGLPALVGATRELVVEHYGAFVRDLGLSWGDFLGSVRRPLSITVEATSRRLTDSRITRPVGTCPGKWTTSGTCTDTK